MSERAIGNEAAGLDHGGGELEERVGLWVGGGDAAGVEDRLRGEAGALADEAVGGETVVAGVLLGDGERDLLAGFWGKHTRGERAAEAEVGFERGGRVAKRAQEIRHQAEFGLHAGEEFGGLAGGGGGIERGDAGHDVSWVF